MTATDRSQEMITVAAQAAADKLAHNLIAFDVSDVLSITDAFLIASAANDRQVKAIAEEIEDQLREQLDVKPVRREGEREGRWILLDYLDIVVHVQHAEERSFYSPGAALEGLPGAGAAGGRDGHPEPAGAEEFSDEAGESSRCAVLQAAADRSLRGGGSSRMTDRLLATGQTAWNLEGPFPGRRRHRADRDRYRAGQAAARLLAGAAPGLPVISSDLQRAADTAAELAGLTGLDVTARRGPAGDVRG